MKEVRQDKPKYPDKWVTLIVLFLSAVLFAWLLWLTYLHDQALKWPVNGPQF